MLIFAFNLLNEHQKEKPPSTTARLHWDELRLFSTITTAYSFQKRTSMRYPQLRGFLKH